HRRHSRRWTSPTRTSRAPRSHRASSSRMICAGYSVRANKRLMSNSRWSSSIATIFCAGCKRTAIYHNRRSCLCRRRLQLDPTPVKQSVLNPVAQVAEAMAKTAKSGSAAAWIIKLHPDDWNVVTAGKIRQEAARKGATLSARAYQHALAKMRAALIQLHDKR